jgi:hypothetical protein
VIAGRLFGPQSTGAYITSLCQCCGVGDDQGEGAVVLWKALRLQQWSSDHRVARHQAQDGIAMGLMVKTQLSWQANSCDGRHLGAGEEAEDAILRDLLGFGCVRECIGGQVVHD